MTDYADRIMRGEITTADVPEQIRPAVEHIIKLPIYRVACEVLDGIGTEARNRNLARVPELLRPLVRAEAERIFNYRKNNG